MRLFPVILPFLFFAPGCTSNLFPPNAGTDKALLYGAEQDIDADKYGEALTKLGQLSTAFADQDSVKIVRASAHGGACGLRFIPFFEKLGNIDFSPFFSDLASTFVQVSTNASQCVTAENLVTSVSALDDDDRFFYVMLNLAKIGAILRTNADVDGTDELGDGTTDVTFDVCSADSISDEDVANVIVGLSLFISNFSALAANLSSTSLDIDDITAACNADPSLNALCNSTTVEAATPHVANMRKLLDSSTYGVGTCADPTGLTCCP